MKRTWLKLIGLAALVIAVLALEAGYLNLECSKSDTEIQWDKLRAEANSELSTINNFLVQTSGKEDDYRQTAAQENFAFYAPYADREQWQNSFDAARNKAEEAKSIIKEEFEPLTDEGKAEEIENGKNLLKRADQALADASRLANLPSERMALLTKVKNEGGQMLAASRAQLTESQTLAASLAQTVETTKQGFPQKQEDLKQRFAQFENRLKDSTASLAQAESQAASPAPDYAAWGDASVLVENNFNWIKEEDPKLRGKIAELGKTYSLILADQRQDFYVTIQKTVWDESSDANTDSDYSYQPRPVSRETYNYFEGLPENDALDLKKVDANAWNSLNIDLTEGKNNSGREFYIADLPLRYFHKYLIEENGQLHEEDWKEVDEATFEANEANLGMQLLTKPVGIYEEEALKVAAPAGFAYANDPRHGEWRSDAQGNSFWAWFGPYALFSTLLGGNNVIYRNEWDTWSRDYRGRQPYYGKEEAEQKRYGTYSGGWIGGTAYARGGGLEAQDPSVRGAGPDGRGGGPSGGGK